MIAPPRPDAEPVARRPVRLTVILPVGIGLVAANTLLAALLITRAQPAITGSVSFGLASTCPGPFGDLTGSDVVVRSSTGQEVTTQLGPPISGASGTLSASWPVCYYLFEIQRAIPGDTLTFTVRGCSATFSNDYLVEHEAGIDLTDC